MTHPCEQQRNQRRAVNYGVASGSRIDKITCFFCTRALSKRQYSAKKTYISIDPTDRSHPIPTYLSFCKSLSRSFASALRTTATCSGSVSACHVSLVCQPTYRSRQHLFKTIETCQMCVVIRDSSTQAASQDSLQHSVMFLMLQHFVMFLMLQHFMMFLYLLQHPMTFATPYDVSLSVSFAHSFPL